MSQPDKVAKIGDTACVKVNFSSMLLPAKGFEGAADPAMGLSFHAGVAHAPEAGQPAKLQVNLYSSPKLSLWVLDTDYSSYAVVYSCSLKLGGMTSDQVCSVHPTLLVCVVNCS